MKRTFTQLPMTLRHLCAATSVALALAAAAQAQVPAADAAHEPLSFEAARTRYHAEADILKADDAEVARARHEADAAKWLDGPKVDVTAMQVEGTKTLDLSLDLPPSLSGVAGQLGIPSSLSLSDKMDIGGPRAFVSAVWPIYTGGAISAQQNALSAKAMEAEAARDERAVQKDAELAMKYWQAQLMKSISALRASALADEEEAVRRALGFEKTGMISKIERMSVEVSRDAAKRALTAAKTDEHVADTELLNALRLPALPALSTPLFVLQGELGTLDEWLELADRQSPVVRRIDEQRKQADQGVEAAKSRFEPQVFAFGMKNMIKHYLTLPEPDWIAGVGVKFTLWDNRDRFASLHAAQSLSDKASAAKNEARNEVRNAVEVAYLRAQQARDEYRLSASQVALAQENLKARQASFAEGLSTAIDVSQARTLLVGAQIAERAAAFKFVAGWAMLHAAAGDMPGFVNSLSRSDLETVR